MREVHRWLALLPAHLDVDPLGIENQQVEVVAARVVPVGGHGHLLGGRQVHELRDRGVDRPGGEGRPPLGRRDEMQEVHPHSLSDRAVRQPAARRFTPCEPRRAAIASLLSVRDDRSAE